MQKDVTALDRQNDCCIERGCSTGGKKHGVGVQEYIVGAEKQTSPKTDRLRILYYTVGRETN